jgi:hypothetical protein
MADICARGPGGPFCALSSGSAFLTPTTWTAGYSDGEHWNTGPEYWSTIRFPDLDGDGKADVCGRGRGGLVCALDWGAGFAMPSVWSSNYSDANGWNRPEYYSTISY